MKPHYNCHKCGKCIGYIGWFFTALRIPLVRHVCKEKK